MMMRVMTTTKHIITTIALLLFIVLLCEGSPELSQLSRSISTRDLNGTIGEKTDPCFTAFIKWTAEVLNAKEMWSTITAVFYLEKTNKIISCNYNIGNFKSDQYTITIDEQKRPGRATFSFTHNAPAGTKQTIGTSTSIVTHNADGTKSVTISATLYSGTSLGTFTVSDTVELDPFAVTVEVTFNGNGGTPSETKKSVTYGEAYGELPNATRTGCTFLGWFTIGGAEITNSSIVNTTTNFILYAHWTINSYTISFNTSGGSFCSPITQNYNTTITLPSTTKTGHTFDYWCDDSALTSRYTASTMPPENIVLYAKYTINSYTVTFLSDRSVVNSEQLDYQNNITHPGNLTKAGYSLAGWNSSITSVPDHDVVIDALWTANAYVVEFDPNGGDELANRTMDVTYDDVYGELPEATREGHTFLGWFTTATDGCEVTSNSTVSITDNHTLYAQWSIISYSVSSDSNIEIHESSSKSSKDESATNFVEVVFGAKDLSKDEIEDIIKRYTGSGFTIVDYKDGNNAGNTMVIIKFTSIGAAEAFVKNVRAAEEAIKDYIKRVSFSSEKLDESNSISLCPLTLFPILL